MIKLIDARWELWALKNKRGGFSQLPEGGEGGGQGTNIVEQNGFGSYRGNWNFRFFEYIHKYGTWWSRRSRGSD